MRRQLSVAALVVGTPGLVFGAPSETELAFSLGYDPPVDCPSRAEFEQAVVSRAPSARAAERDRATLIFETELAISPPGVSAVLWATLPDGTRSRRDVFGESCSEAVAALAVIAALSLESYRESKSGTQPPTSSVTATDAPAVMASAPPPAESTPNAAEKAAPPRVDEPPSSRRETPTRGNAARPGLFVAGAWESAVAPSAPLGVLAGVELGWDRRGAWWPSIRAGVLATLTAAETGEEWRAMFRLTTARVGFCPLGGGDVGSPAIHGCVEFDGGKLDASGSGSSVSGESSASMTWLAIGPAGRGEWPLGAGVSVEASAGLRALVQHDRFVFRPDTVVYDVPPLSAGLGLGVVGRLP